jgi:hypothetical protein
VGNPGFPRVKLGGELRNQRVPKQTSPAEFTSEARRIYHYRTETEPLPLSFISVGGRPSPYTGKFLDEQNGRSNHIHRWLDPKLDKWICEDPIGVTDGETKLKRFI